MNKVVADALTLVYKFLMPLCSKFNPALIERGLLSIAGEDAFDFSSQLMPLGSYEKVQSTLARLNERESIRKNKGVYYTPTDVVDFIVANTIKASLGVLTPENIHSLDLASEFDEDFCLKKTVFEPTCGAGEFLLATLEQKLKLWRRNHFEATKEDRSVPRGPSDIRPMDLLVFHFVYTLSGSAKKSLNVTPSATQIRSIVGTPN